MVNRNSVVTVLVAQWKEHREKAAFAMERDHMAEYIENKAKMETLSRTAELLGISQSEIIKESLKK